MNITKARDYGRLSTLAAVALLVTGSAGVPVMAQGLDSETAVQTIIGSDVESTEVPIKEVGDRLVAAIGNVTANTREVRRRFNLGDVGIVTVLDDETADSAAVAESIEASQIEINDLRIAIEGSAMFYHAVNSRRILLSDIIAMEFEGDDVLIYVLNKQAQ